MDREMNEKIKQFGEQAIHYAASRPMPELKDRDLYLDNLFEKFAELIVRECSRVIVNGGYWSGGPIGPKRQCTPPEIAQMIKEHFGVEE